ncbi:putative linoleate 13S-lipoxygenase [Helianthus anomalus]
MTFNIKTIYSLLKAVIPSLETTLIDKNLGFPYFTAIDSLFNEGVNLPPIESDGFLKNILPRLLKSIEDAQNNILLFETPEMIDRDKFGWIRDEEFCRQTLAGLNPLSITLVKGKVYWGTLKKWGTAGNRLKRTPIGLIPAALEPSRRTLTKIF